MANRRLYRQSRVYNLKVDVEVDSAAATNGVDVYVLRDTWDLHGAYKFAMKSYYNAMKEELMNANGAKTRWHDFRAWTQFLGDELVPQVANPDPSLSVSISTLTAGDHDLSMISDSTGTLKMFGLDSASSGSVYSIIEEWKRKNRVHSDPASAAADMPYGGIVEDLDEANYDILKDNGAVPPYDDEAGTSVWQKVAVLKQTTPAGIAKLTSGFIEAPLGLVLLVSTAFTTDIADRGLSVSYQTGSYKGVKAAPYATPMLTDAKEYEVV